MELLSSRFKTQKKGQSAIEFMIIVAAMMVFFISFFFALQVQKSDEIRENINLQVKDVAIIIKDEINLASEASDGYSRNFLLPVKISGSLEYYVSINDNLLYVRTADGKYAMGYPIIDVIGQPAPGDNLIRKSDGKIYLN